MQKLEAGSAIAPKPGTLGARFVSARAGKGLTRYAVAKLAGVPNPATIRAIELGKDAKLSTLEAVAKALELKLDLVEE